MGAQVSTTVSETENEIITKSVNQCKRGVASNELYLQGFTHRAAPQCKNPTFSVEQSAVVDASCFINALQDNMANTIKNLSTTAQGGFGIQGATSIDRSKQLINAQLENICGGASSQNLVSHKDIETNACDVAFVQNASSKSKCEIEALQKAAIQTDTTMETGAKGASISDLLFGSGMSLIIWAIVILVVLGGVYYYMKGRGKGTQIG